MKNIKNRPYQQLFIALTFIFPALILTACGGGGGSSPQNTISTGGVTPDDCVSTPGTPSTCGNAPSNNAGGSGIGDNSIIIDDRNAAEVTNSVLGIIDIFYNLGERQGTGGGIVTATQGSPEPGSFSLAGLAFSQLAYMAELDSLSLLNTPMVVGIHTPQIVPCSNSAGSVQNLSVDATTIIARFSDCVIDGTTLNGDLTISEFDVSPNVNVVGTEWAMTALFTFTGGLSISDDTDTITVNSGAMRFSANADVNSIGRGRIQVESPVGISYQDNQTVTLQGNRQNAFTIDYSFDPSTTTTLSINGGLSRSSGSTSALTVATRQELTRFSGATLGNLPPGPYDNGQLRIMSSDSSNVTLEILTSTDVLLNVNDNTTTLNMTWIDLLNS